MKERKLFTFCLFFLLISFGILHLWGEHLLNDSQIEKKIPPGAVIKVTGQVHRKEEASDYQILYLKNISVTYQNVSIKESKFIIYNKNPDRGNNIKVGNKIACQGEISFFEMARNPGNFDRKFYYQKQGIFACVWTESVEITEGSVFGIRNWLSEWKEQWRQYFIETAGEEKGGILCAMLLGDKSSMDAEVKELYQINGIAHILAISGLHLSFIGHGFYQIIRKTSGSYLLGGLVGIIFMGLYITMIGMSVSAIRAVVMFLLRVVADMSGRVYDAPTSVALAAAVAIVWRPWSFYDGGFQLSFGAIIGVLFLNPLFSGKKKDKNFLKNSFMTNISVQIVTFPILLYHFYEFPLYSILLNMIVVPCMSALLFLAIAGGLEAIFAWFPGTIFIKGCSVILATYEWLCQTLSEFPMFRVVTGQPDLKWILLYYFCVGAAVLWIKLDHQNKRWGMGFCAAGCIILLINSPMVAQKELEITTLDVGQGDCIFLRGENLACLIDGGSSDVKNVGKYRIESFLKYRGVGTLDYIFVSHGDSDHISGIKEMLARQKEGIRIECVVFPNKDIWDEALWKLARTAEENQTKVAIMEEGMTIQQGGLKINCLQSLGKSVVEAESIEIGNASSMVLELTYYNFNMLVTGDLEHKGETLLCEKLTKEYDVLKVAHHGSKNSTTEGFLEIVKPGIGLISAGKDNSYGHPHAETLERLETAGSSIYTTPESGAIEILTDGEKMWVDEYVEEGYL